MPFLLSSIFANSQRPHHPFLLLQSSTAQSCIPILRKLINLDPHNISSKRSRTLLFCFLFPPSSLLEDNAILASQGGTVEVFDYTTNVPGYEDSWINPCDGIVASVNAGECVVILKPKCQNPILRQLTQDH